MNDSGMSGRRPARRQPQRRPVPQQRRPVPPQVTGAFAAAASNEPLSFGVLIGSIGGVLGIVESVLPSLVFLVVYQFTSLVPAVLSSVGVAAVFVVVRLIRRSTPTAAFAGAIGIAVSAVLALVTGNAAAFYGPGIILNAIYAIVFAVSALVRWPILGVAGSLLFNDQRGWKPNRAKYRVFLWVTWLWVALFVVRLVVEVPLYLSSAPGHDEALGIARLITGVPLYAPVLVVTVLAVRAVYRSGSDAAVS